jgi:hypothetical protein
MNGEMFSYIFTGFILKEEEPCITACRNNCQKVLSKLRVNPLLSKRWRVKEIIKELEVKMSLCWILFVKIAVGVFKKYNLK